MTSSGSSNKWYAATDAVTNSTYYYNEAGDTSWTNPASELNLDLKLDKLHLLVSKLDFLSDSNKMTTTTTTTTTTDTNTDTDTTPTYRPSSPAYDYEQQQSSSPVYRPSSPAYDCEKQQQQQQQQSLSSSSSPVYRPSSPLYAPTLTLTSALDLDLDLKSELALKSKLEPALELVSAHAPDAHTQIHNISSFESPGGWADACEIEDNKDKDKGTDKELGEIESIGGHRIDPMHLPYTSVPTKPHYHTEPPPFVSSTLTRPEHPLKRVFGILNWTKAILIRAVLGIWGEDASVLVGCELGCGNGRDASKWGYALKDTRQSMYEMVLVDYREKVLVQAEENFKKELTAVKKITKIDHDLTSRRMSDTTYGSLSDNINSAVAFHLLQFIWSSEEAARTTLDHISNMLIPGGPVVFIYTDAGQVLARLRQEEWGNPGQPMEQRTLTHINKLFTLSCTSMQLRKFEERDASPYGHRIKLMLAGGPPSNEFLVPPASLMEILKDSKMSTLIDMPMHAFLHKLVRSEQNSELGRKMRMFGEAQALDANEWETLSLYRVTVAVHGTKVEAVNAAKCWMSNRLFGSDS